MSEQEPTNDKPSIFYLNMPGGSQELCTPDNFKAYMHENSDYDHCYLVIDQNVNEDGNIVMMGHYLWRQHIPAFDDVIDFMTDRGFNVTYSQEPAEQDLEAYTKAHPEDVPMPDLEEEWGATKLRECQNMGKFLAYLMETNQMDLYE